MDKNYNKIKEYLKLVPPFEMKRHVWGLLGLMNIFNPLILNFINDLGLKQSVSQPRNLILLIITILFDAWGVFILFRIDKSQKQFILYTGLISIFFSLTYLSIFYDIIYMILRVKSLFYIIASVLVFIVVLAFNFFALRDLITSGYYSDEEKRKENWTALVLLVVGVGIIGLKLYNEFSDLRSQLAMLGLAISVFGYLFLFTTHNVYKYYLIKKYNKCLVAHVLMYPQCNLKSNHKYKGVTK